MSKVLLFSGGAALWRLEDGTLVCSLSDKVLGQVDTSPPENSIGEAFASALEIRNDRAERERRPHSGTE